MAFGEMQDGGDMIGASDLIEPEIDPSDIQEFYANKTILLTGGTGFLGMVILEKLLRSCPKLRMVYLLTRAKKSMTMEERLNKQFSSPLYDKLKLKSPALLTKVQPIAGDVGEENLGLSPGDQEILSKEVEIIIHGAATVRFDEHIRIAVNINIRGTRDLLKLAKKMKHLKAFIHISTAYSNCPMKEIDEKFYDAPYDYEKLLTLVESANDQILDQITPALCGQWPNTYVFTKAVAEDVVKRYGKGLPVAVVRPAQIISTLKEPIAGWINNFYGVTGATYGTALGLLRTLHCDPEKLADLVPVDLVSNCIVASAWEIGSMRSENQEVASNSEISIYNYVGSVENPICWQKSMDLSQEFGKEIPSNRSLWLPYIFLNKYKHVHLLYVVFLHFLPGFLVDLLLRAVGRQPILLSTYRKIHKFSHVIAYFCTQEWKFHNDNTQALYKKLSPSDRQLFDFSMKNFTWEEYFPYYLRGMRIYIGNDPMETVPQGKRKRKMFIMANYIICGIICYCFYSFCLFLLSWIF